jgi:hypothetical protein
MLGLNPYEAWSIYVNFVLLEGPVSPYPPAPAVLRSNEGCGPGSNPHPGVRRGLASQADGYLDHIAAILWKT